MVGIGHASYEASRCSQCLLRWEPSRNPVPGGQPAGRALWGGQCGLLSVQPGSQPRSPRGVPCLEEHVPAVPGPPACWQLPGRHHVTTVTMSCVLTCRPFPLAAKQCRGALPGA